MAVNFIFYYGITFFQNSGIRDPFIIAIVTNAVNVVMTIPGIYGVERFGRRRLLLVGCMGMCLCEYIIAVVGETISVQDLAGQQVLILFVCVFIAFFASTWGPLTWTIVSEIYPLELRAKAMSISTASNWFSNFVVTYSRKWSQRPILKNLTPLCQYLIWSTINPVQQAFSRRCSSSGVLPASVV